MRKSQKREPVFRGAITAFLAMIFVLMLSLVGALLESVSVQMTKNRNRADTSLALESTFAEYNRQMLEEYDLFVRNACSESALQTRLEYYGADNLSHSIIKRELLTDNGGAAFREQAIRYMKHRFGLQDLPQGTKYDFYSETYLEEEELVYMDLEELLAQEENDLPEENNPLNSVKRLKSTDLLTILVANAEELSNRRLEVDALPSQRDLEKGTWGQYISEEKTDKVFLVSYLTEHFTNICNTKESRALLYEQEYLLGGCAADRENLEKVCKRILSVRMVANYAYLLTDTAKQAEAEALSLTLCSLLTVPGITEVVKHAILLGWAYGESIVDVRTLLKGKRVAAVKSADTWQLRLANLVKLGTDEEEVSEMDVPGGLSYQTYLTGLLFMQDKEVLSMRSLDLIESNLHIKTDECMTKIEIKSKATLRRGVKDSFTTAFQYQ